MELVMPDMVGQDVLAHGSKHRSIHAGHPGTGDIDVQSLEVIWQAELAQLQLRIALRAVRSVVLEPIQVLVALPTDLTAVGLLLFHSHGAGIRDRSQGIHNRKGAILVLL